MILISSVKSNLHLPEISTSSMENRTDDVTYWNIEMKEVWK